MGTVMGRWINSVFLKFFHTQDNIHYQWEYFFHSDIRMRFFPDFILQVYLINLWSANVSSNGLIHRFFEDSNSSGMLSGESFGMDLNPADTGSKAVYMN